jgi:5-methylcytosine-specific restriction endonuclease McrA
VSRKVPEWIGKTDDSEIPARVRLRVFDRCGGVCHLSQRKIGAGEHWQLDHVVAIINGGQHRESNLVPVLTGPHKEKTKIDVAEKSRMYYKRAKAIGLKRKRRTIPGRKFDGTPVPAKWK